MTEYNIRLNPNCASVVHTGLKFKSGDKGIVFKIAVDELDTTGTTAKIVFQRANGTSVESDITGTDNVYTYTTLGNEFAVPGKTVADVKFYVSGKRESTASFVFEVCSDTMAGLGAGTAGYSDRLEQLVEEAEEAGELTERARVELETAESDMEAMKAEMAAVLQNFKEQYGEEGALNPRSAWNSEATYQLRDVVSHSDCLWISLVENTNVEPTKENDATWMLGLEASGASAEEIQNIISGITPVGDSKKLGGKGASAFVQGASPFFASGETILDWANNPNGVYNKMALTEIGIPSDGVANISGFYTLKIDDGARKIVTFHGWYANVTKQRHVWAGEWTGDWEGLDADTVDGYHASEFVRMTVEECADLNTFKEINKFMNATYGYATNLPPDASAYAKAINIGLPNAFMQLYFPSDSSKKIQFRNYVEWGSPQWTGWMLGATTADLANYLSITGGTLRGPFTIDNGDGANEGGQIDLMMAVNSTLGGSVAIDAFLDYVRIFNLSSDGKLRGVAIDLAEIQANSIDTNKILHTGNSAKVVQATSAPSDATAVWVDTANNKVKAYKDGAWTAMA